MKPIETIEVDHDPVGCDGGGGALGHPLVYLTIGAEHEAVCPYCSRKYVMKPGAKAGGHGH